MRHSIFTITALLLAFSTTALAQTNTVGTAKAEDFAVRGATIHVGNGQVIENGVVGVKNGKIALVSADANALKESEYKRIIDAKGQHLYPSIIAPNTQLGLTEIEAVRATRDFYEVGHFNPHVRSLIAYNTDSEILPTISFNGILLAQTCPQGGRISGQSSVVQLSAYNWEDATVSADVGVHLYFPQRFQYTGWWAEPGPLRGVKGYDKDVQAVKVYFDEAAAYMQREKVEGKNLKFEVMRSLLSRKTKLFLHVDEAQSTLDALDLLAPYKLDIVLIGGGESYLITDRLRADNIPVVYTNTHELPTTPDSDVDQMFKTPAMLAQAGVKYCLALNGSWQVRNLPFLAGNTAAYGIDKETALRSVTLSTAEILGIAQRVGSIEVGKDATFFLSIGDALDMRTNQLTAAFVQARALPLISRQQVLYDKYMQKFGLKKQ